MAWPTTRELIQQNTSFMAGAENVAIYRIEDKCVARLAKEFVAAREAVRLAL
jgi:hypothetical protein